MRFFLIFFIFCYGLMPMEKYKPVQELADRLCLNEKDRSNLILAVANLFGEETEELFALLFLIDDAKSRESIRELSKIKAKNTINKAVDHYFRLADYLEIDAALKSFEQLSIKAD